MQLEFWTVFFSLLINLFAMSLWIWRITTLACGGEHAQLWIVEKCWLRLSIAKVLFDPFGSQDSRDAQNQRHCFVHGKGVPRTLWQHQHRWAVEAVPWLLQPCLAIWPGSWVTSFKLVVFRSARTRPSRFVHCDFFRCFWWWPRFFVSS